MLNFLNIMKLGQIAVEIRRVERKDIMMIYINR
jgi:hypothetical protein